jgi:hypothetical protein
MLKAYIGKCIPNTNCANFSPDPIGICLHEELCCSYSKFKGLLHKELHTDGTCTLCSGPHENGNCSFVSLQARNKTCMFPESLC